MIGIIYAVQLSWERKEMMGEFHPDNPHDRVKKPENCDKHMMPMMQRFYSFVMSAVIVLSGMAVQPAKAANVYESPMAPVIADPIDRHVFGKLKRMGIKPVLCSDAVFIRRAYIDITGTIPTSDEVRLFLKDRDLAGKRRVLVDRLLETEAYADYWAMKWSDILRIKAEYPINLWPIAAQGYHRWIRASIAANKPYNVFARELLTSSGSNFHDSPVNFYRAVQTHTPEGIASAVALTLMGSRTDSWPAGRLRGMAVFFSQIGFKPTSEWKEEYVFWDPLATGKDKGNTAPGRAAVADIGRIPAESGKSGDLKKRTVGQQEPVFRVSPIVPKASPKVLAGIFPDGSRVRLSPERDPREVFADWLIRPDNPWFARAAVNRVWSWLVGRGIIHEPDDIRPGNPPCNPRLLASLERQFIADGYDLKRLCRRILNSSTYQLSSVPQVMTAAAEANFSSYPLRRIDAEVLIDAINKITGATDHYTSAIPEPYTYIPADQPAVAIADGSITSPFLALFGRSARTTGMESERNNRPMATQWLHMLNSSHIQRKLEQGPRLRKLINSPGSPEKKIEELYLAILSRYPTADELKALSTIGEVKIVKKMPQKQINPGKEAKGNDDPKQAELSVKGQAKGTSGQQLEHQTIYVKRPKDWVDISWALINSLEFQYRH